MQAVNSRFTIDGDTLIAYDNKRYPKIPYTSELHEELVYKLQDPEYAKVLYKAYEKYMAPTLSADQKVIFEKSLIATAPFFGSSDHPPKSALERTLLRNGWQGELPELRTFIFHTEVFFTKERGEIRRVCIITTTASGGNSAVTRAVNAFFTSRALECQVIDIETFAKQHDTIQKATGYSYDELYAEIFQKKNQPNIQNGFPEFLTEREALNRSLAKYIAPCTMQKVRDTIKCLSPDLIISTRSYTFEDIYLAHALNTPMRILYCDWHHFIHVDQIGKNDPSLVKFWLPSLSSRAFSHLLKNETNPDDSWQQTAEKIAALTKMTANEVLASFEEIGYPVGDEYVPIDDEAELCAIRKRWELKESDQPVLVTMGKNGVGILRDLFLQITRAPKNKTYFFVTGTNHELKEKFSKEVSKLGLSHVRVLGHISHQDMADLMNISAFVVSKPGGAQTAQCLAMGKKMHIPFAHTLWESGNEYELKKRGFTTTLNSEIAPIKPQTVLNWRERIEKALQLCERRGFAH